MAAAAPAPRLPPDRTATIHAFRDSRRAVRVLLAALVAWPLSFFALPLLRDGFGGPCQALETRLRVLMTAGASPAAFDGETRALAERIAWLRRDVVLDGSIARSHVAAFGEERPVWLGCYARYWTVAFSL